MYSAKGHDLHEQVSCVIPLGKENPNKLKHILKVGKITITRRYSYVNFPLAFPQSGIYKFSKILLARI